MKGWEDSNTPHVFYGGNTSTMNATEYTDEDDNVMNGINIDLSENRLRKSDNDDDDEVGDNGDDDDENNTDDNDDKDDEDDVDNDYKDEDKDIVIDEHIDHWLTSNNESTPMKNASRHVSCKL